MNSKLFFFKLINNAVFGKTVENVRKHRYIKLVRSEARRTYLVSEPNYITIKLFSENLLPTEIKKHTYSWINLSAYVYQY